MKTLLIATIALSALSGAAFAGNFEGNNQAPYRLGTSDVTTEALLNPSQTHALASDATAVQSTGSGWYMGSYGLTKDPSDIRRWEEKN